MILRNRWAALALLFFVRTSMAVQFQSVAAIGPLMSKQLTLGLSDIGLLIGLYFAPGVALALPGGAFGRRFGDKTAVLVGLALMLIGGAIALLTPSWPGQMVGRLVAGTGGVLLNVLMTKMVTDWFAGREIATAMAIFINSWPCGIAMSLLVLPVIGATYGLFAVNVAVLLAVVLAALLLVRFYGTPASAAANPAEAAMPDGSAVIAVILAGSIWTAYNIGFAMVFSFGPTMLSEQGWPVTTSGATISIILWLTVLSVPLGGFLTDYFKRGDLILTCACIAFSVLLLAIPRSEAVVPLVVVLGLVSGLPAGPIMSLPAQYLKPSTRALGMGHFYTVFYAGMLIGPAAGGRYANWIGGAAHAFDFGALVLLVCPILLTALRCTTHRHRAHRQEDRGRRR